MDINKSLKFLLLIIFFLVATTLLVNLINLRTPQPKTVFDSCYEKCVQLGVAPDEYGNCGDTYHLSTRVSTNEPWCLNNAGKCLNLCLNN